MAVKIETFDMPVGIEASVWRIDAAVKRDKTPPVQVTASGDGHPTVSFFDADGSVTAVTFIDGDWHEIGLVV